MISCLSTSRTMPDSTPSESHDDWQSRSTEARRQQIAELKANDDLSPPWVICPQIPCGSIGWRMGEGECVMCDWNDWVRGLSSARFADYCARHKPSEPWLARFTRTIRLFCSRFGLAPRKNRTWPEWFESVTDRLENELTTLSWEDYWDARLREFETKFGE